MKYLKLFENKDKPKEGDYIIYITNRTSTAEKYNKMIGKITKTFKDWYIVEYNMGNGFRETTPIYYPDEIVYWSNNKEDCIDILANFDAYLTSKKYNL